MSFVYRTFDIESVLTHANLSNHFAISGRAAAQVKDTIRPVVEEHQPDLVLVLLGFNDLAFGFGNATGTLINMQTLIQNARSAHPDTTFVIGTVPQRTWIGSVEQVTMTDEYNRRLRAEGPGWSLPSSPVRSLRFPLRVYSGLTRDVSYRLSLHQYEKSTIAGHSTRMTTAQQLMMVFIRMS
jgi:hypothetical protein